MLFAPTRYAVDNLRKEGLEECTYLTGDTMVDAILAVMPRIRKKEGVVLRRLGLSPRDYVLMTLHRPSNVDNPTRLNEILAAVRKVAGKLKVAFPAHPRTRGNLKRARVLGGLKRGRVMVMRPLGYVDNLCLLNNASCLLTDSGGMQKESYLLHVPCITVRSTTEWPETLARKANRLVNDPKLIEKEVLAAAFDEDLRKSIRRLRNPFGDGRASVRIGQLISNAMKTQ
jgi:UDP-N-acetylglucosamine 2-epimerase